MIHWQLAKARELLECGSVGAMHCQPARQLHYKEEEGNNDDSRDQLNQEGHAPLPVTIGADVEDCSIAAQ